MDKRRLHLKTIASLVLAFVCFSCILFALQLPGEQTRGLKEPPPTQIVVNPTPDGFDVSIHWGELAAMCAVISGAYWAIAKLVIGPMIDKKLSEFMIQIEEKYVPREIVEAHFHSDDKRSDSLEKRLDQIWEIVSRP